VLGYAVVEDDEPDQDLGPPTATGQRRS